MSEVFSKVIRAAPIRGTAQVHEVKANAAQLAGLAALFGLPAIKALQGRFVLTHEQAGVIGAVLRLQAQVTQICVITLESFDAGIDETVALRFVPAGLVKEGAEIGEVDAETLEGPDEIPYAGEVIDLGAALAEQLALSLDPYPRRPGALLPEGASEDAAHPFAALAQRRDVKGKA